MSVFLFILPPVGIFNAGYGGLVNSRGVGTLMTSICRAKEQAQFEVPRSIRPLVRYGFPRVPRNYIALPKSVKISHSGLSLVHTSQ